MKTQQELMQAYWGPGGTVDMVKEYNAKHGCDVKPWECVKFEGVTFNVHPTFDGRSVYYEFALTILYDDKRKEHRPVWEGSELYFEGSELKYTVEENGYSVQDACIYGYDWITSDGQGWSWNPPPPKRTFKIGDLELPCPVRKGEGEYVSSVCGIEYYFTDYNDRNKVASAIANILIAARDKE